MNDTNAPSTFMISGHTDLTQADFDKFYKPEIDNTPHGSHFILGNANGVDSLALEYLKKLNKGHITICSKGHNHGLEVDNAIRIVSGFCSFPERDAYMSANSDKDIAFIRNDHMALGSGTMGNLIRRAYGISVAKDYIKAIRSSVGFQDALTKLEAKHPDFKAQFVQSLVERVVMKE